MDLTPVHTLAFTHTSLERNIIQKGRQMSIHLVFCMSHILIPVYPANSVCLHNTIRTRTRCIDDSQLT